MPGADPSLTHCSASSPYTLLGDGLGEALGETFGLGVFRRGGGAACDASEPCGDMSGSFLIMGSVYSWISLRMREHVGIM